ncbi:MAG TPA: DUF885 domain-containing protein, partial [Stenotrophomonas sp.]|nr:DUF885 domain-containing protein [Stenotrophomonas sp.]
MKPLVLAVALALTVPAALSAPPALAAPAAAKPAASPAWVTRSNTLAQILLDAQGPFQ